MDRLFTQVVRHASERHRAKPRLDSDSARCEHSRTSTPTAYKVIQIDTCCNTVFELIAGT